MAPAKKKPKGPQQSCDCGAPSIAYVNPNSQIPYEEIALRLYIDPKTRKSYSICKHGNAFEYEKVTE